MGRRRKRSSENQGKVEYFFPVPSSIKPAVIRRNNSRILDKEERLAKEASIKDNVGVTIIMPGGKQSFSERRSERRSNFLSAS